MESEILIVAAHPDDAELGIGGIIASLSAAGKSVAIVDLSDGEPTPCGSPEIRAQETRKASAILGVSERRMLGIKNREIFDSIENRKKLATVIRELKPKLLFAPYWEDAHPDHVAAATLANAARFYAKLTKTDMPHDPHYPARIVHYFSIHMRLRVRPSAVYDTSEQHARKMEAVAAYHSQFSANEKNRGVIARLEAEAAYWGQQIGRRFGEPLITREDVRLSTPEALLDI